MTRLQLSAVRTCAVIAELTRRGCRITEAHAHLDPPVVRISPPPHGLFDTYGYLTPPAGTVRVPVLCVAEKWHTRIEWVSREAHQ